MISYADYEFYKKEFKGIKLTKEEFERFAILSCAFIDMHTFNRIKKIKKTQNIDENIKMAVCGVCEIIKEEDSYNAAVSSENLDGYSVNITSPNIMRKDYNNKKIRLLDAFIPRSNPLRFRGV